MSLMEDDEDGFIGEWVDDNEEETQCLFTPRRFPNAKLAMQVDLESLFHFVCRSLKMIIIRDI